MVLLGCEVFQQDGPKPGVPDLAGGCKGGAPHVYVLILQQRQQRTVEAADPNLSKHLCSEGSVNRALRGHQRPKLLPGYEDPVYASVSQQPHHSTPSDLEIGVLEVGCHEFRGFGFVQLTQRDKGRGSHTRMLVPVDPLPHGPGRVGDLQR